MGTLERAVEIAARAHAGQTDKAGAPYLLHPLRVMMSLTLPEDRITGVLHDVVEDTPVTFADLQAEGFAPEIIQALRALTKAPGESRIDAARRAGADPIALRVKLADIGDNMDLSRIAEPSSKDLTRLEEYREVKTYLQSCLSSAAP